MKSIPLPTGLALLAVMLATITYLVWRLVKTRRQGSVSLHSDLEALGRVGRALVEFQFDLSKLYELILEQAGVVIDTTTFQLGLFEGDDYHIVVWIKEGVRQQPAQFLNARETGLVGWVAENKQNVVIHDFESEWSNLPARPQYLSPDPPKSAIFVPLITGDECIGVMAAQSSQADMFSQDDCQRLEILANQAASAIVTSRLYEQNRARAAQLEIVSRVAQRVRALLPLQGFLAHVVDLVHDSFHYYCVNILIVNPKDHQVTLEASSSTAFSEFFHGLPTDGGLINWALDHQQAVVVNDVGEDARYTPTTVLPETQSEMVVPLMVENEMLGVLDIQSNIQRAFQPLDQFVMEILADQLALAIQESRLFDAEQHQRSVAETLQRLSQTLTSSLELDEVLGEILKGLGLVIPNDAAAILLTENDETLVVRAATGFAHATQVQGFRFPINESVRFQMLRESLQPMIFDEHDALGCFHAAVGLESEHSCLGAPLIARGEVIGYLTVDALPPKVFTTSEADVLASFAGQAAIAIENARLYDAQREEAWVSNALLEMVTSVAPATDPNTAVETIANMTVDIMGIEQCGVLMWNKERELFQGARIAGGPSDLSRAFDRVSLAPASWVPLSSIVETARPVMLAGAEALNELPDELFDYFGLEGWLLLLPLLGADDLIGVMLVSGDKDDLESMRHRIHLLGGIAGQATMAIENAQLHQSRQEEAFVTTALLQVSEAVNRLTQLEDVLETIARLTPLLTGASEVALYYQTVPSNICALGGYYGLGSNLDRVRQAKFEFAAGQDGSLGDQGEVEIIIPPTVQSAFSTESVHSILLSSRGTLVGVMLVAFPDSNGQIGARTASLLRGIGHQASTAIEADRLLQESVERERIEQELLVARDIQTSFLPRSFPQEDGWSVGYTWSAARQVAGDFYDFYQLPDDKGGHRWAFVIADVADKGVPAALYMALARTLIRTVGNNQSDPANCLMRVNELLLKDAQSDLFVSVVYVIWNPETGVVRYANAGHDPPLYLRENGSVDVLRHHDRVLGILPVTDLETTELKLAPGEALVLYTDGITEANDESGKEYTRLGLMKAIADYRSKSANEMITRIMADVLKHSGSVDPHDDQTLVIIKRDAATET